MKFPKPQYERILEILKSKSFQLEEFYLVKRKGWIRIEHLMSGSFFTYFKKKETRINMETKQWEHEVYFKIKMSDDKEKKEPTFDSLMGLFEGWVDKLTVKNK